MILHSLVTANPLVFDHCCFRYSESLETHHPPPFMVIGATLFIHVSKSATQRASDPPMDAQEPPLTPVRPRHKRKAPLRSQ
jgi:hypothetical protein